MPSASPRFFLAALSLAGAGAVLLATSGYGAGLSPDAVGYIGVARQLLAGQGVSGYGGQPFVIQPPLYPALLALFGWLGSWDPLAIAPVLNAALCGAVVFLSGQLFTRYRPLLGPMAPFGPALALLSWPLFSVGVMAWSEPLFIAVGTGALLCLGRHLETGGVGWLAAAALGVGLACLTRYIGMAYLVAGGVLVLWGGVGPWGKRLWHLGLFGAIAGLPLVFWLGRNYALTGTWLGPRQASTHTLLENLGLTFAGLAGLWVPELLTPPRLLRLALGGGCALGLAAAALFVVRLSQAGRAPLAPLAPVAVWAAAYAGFLIATSTTTAYDDINLRLLAPLHPALSVLLLAGAGQLAAQGWPRVARTGLAVLLLSSLAGVGTALAEYVRHGAGSGTGADRYNTAPWRESETIRQLCRHPLEGPVYSNAPEALYILCGQEALLAPRRQPGAVWPSAGRLVWLNAVRRRYLLDPDQALGSGQLAVVSRFADGRVYEFLPEKEE